MQKKLPTLLQFKKLVNDYKINHHIKLSEAYEAVSKSFGYKSYNHIKPLLKTLYRANLLGDDSITYNGKEIWLSYGINFGIYETKEEAKNVSSALGASLCILEGKPCFSIHTYGANPYYNPETDGDYNRFNFKDPIPINIFSYDEDTEFKRVTDAKKNSMGRPLDPSNPEDKELIMNLLEYEEGKTDPSYTVYESDYIPYDFSIQKFIDTVGINFELQIISYGYTEI